ncbi:MAG: CcmD family protein [Gemmatimonadaceae bacterium]
MPETSNSTYIIAAYVVTWIALLGYAARLVRTTRRAAEKQAQMPNAGGRNS